MKQGTLVRIKEEWIAHEEERQHIYIVLEDREDRSLVGIVYPESDLFLPPTWCWSDEWIEPLEQ